METIELFNECDLDRLDDDSDELDEDDIARFFHAFSQYSMICEKN